MRVILEYAHWHGSKLYMSGDVLTLDESSARWLIAKGLAEEVEEAADAHIAGDAPQAETDPQPKFSPRRPRGKTLPTPTLPTSGEGAIPTKESEQ